MTDAEPPCLLRPSGCSASWNRTVSRNRRRTEAMRGSFRRVLTPPIPPSLQGAPVASWAMADDMPQHRYDAEIGRFACDNQQALHCTEQCRHCSVQSRPLGVEGGFALGIDTSPLLKS